MKLTGTARPLADPARSLSLVFGGHGVIVGVLALSLLIQVSCTPLPAVAPLERDLQAFLSGDSMSRPRLYFGGMNALRLRYVALQAAQDREVTRQALIGEARLLVHLAGLQPTAPLPKRLTAEQKVVYLTELHRVAVSNVHLALTKVNSAIELSKVYRLKGPCADMAVSVAQMADLQLASLSQQVVELGD